MEQKTHHELIAETLIQAIKDGTAPWQRPWRTGEAMASAPMNPVTGQPYRGTNSLYLRMAGYEDPRWLTYNQAQGIGAQVRKGEKGRTVQYVKTGEMRDALDEAGNPRLDDNGNPVRVFVAYTRPRIFSARVFNAEQMDGIPPLAAAQEREAAIDPVAMHEQIEAILQASDADIRHKYGEQAYYDPAGDYIMLPAREQFVDSAAYYATALHELGHWTGHASRLDRDLSHPFGSVGYAREELRAEISSFMNAQRYGVPHDPARHASYVGSWIGALEDDPQEIISASAEAAKISHYIAGFDRSQTLAQAQTQPSREVQMNREEQTHAAVQQAAPEQEPREARVYLDVPHEEKNQARALGARWDGRAKSWYAPAGADMERLAQWLPENHELLPPHEITFREFARLAKVSTATSLDGKPIWAITYGDTRYYEEGATAKEAIWEVHDDLVGAALYANTPQGREHRRIANQPVPNLPPEAVLREHPGMVRRFPDAFGHVDQQQPVASEQSAIDAEQKAVETVVKEENTMTNVATEKTFLAVPFADKDDAKALGARWDKNAKSWYAPEGTDLAPLQRWIPRGNAMMTAGNHHDPISEFAQALAAAGLVVENIRADGQLHRVPVEGRPRGKDGAYTLHLDGRPSGYIQNFVTGHTENWKSTGTELSDAELAAQRAEMAAIRAQREQEREETQRENARKAADEFNRLPKATPDHPYLAAKGLNQDIIDKLDLRVDGRGHLVVPVKNRDQEIQSVQRIGGNGFKQFESGCKAQGGFAVIGDSAEFAQDRSEPIIISTGMATAASIHLATGEPIVVAFQDSNLRAVAEAFKAMYPYRSFFIAGDNDQHNVTKGLKNSGLESARAAAKAVGGRYAVPTFATGQQGKSYSDYSDLHRIAGLAAVKRQIQAGLAVARGNVAEDNERHQAQEKSQERVEKEVRQRKQEEENAQKKRRSRSI
ncbi:MAG: zincin-like metallopeptidase domain-containing protein [Cardiobacteriaceae bacterium]|nr:zincin-like metallopeptidase domain-containing protein [Cardiobacteriaceae bacterium]